MPLVAWPFSGPFAPLQEGMVDVVEPEGTRAWHLHVVDLGLLKVPSGRLVACDPLVNLTDGVVLRVPAGEYPVKVTVADVSEQQDGSHLREAYLSVILRQGQPATHAVVIPPGSKPPEPDTYYSVGVDSGTVGFVDEVSAKTLLPGGDVPDVWQAEMEADSPLPNGYANIVLPLAKNGENVVMSHSGWGDGAYPVVGAYDGDGRLLSLHIDLQVVGDFTEPAPDPLAAAALQAPKLVGKIETAMHAAGLQPTRATIGGPIAVVGGRSEFRWQWMATRLNTFIYVASFTPGATTQILDDFLKAACQDAINRKGANRGLQSGVAAVTVAIVDNAGPDQVAWATKPHGRRFAAITFPVLVDATTHKVVFPKRMVLGGIYAGYLKDLVRTHVEAAISN
jgi:hypothetical protein